MGGEGGGSVAGASEAASRPLLEVADSPAGFWAVATGGVGYSVPGWA